MKVLSRHLLRRTKEGTIGHLMRGKADNVVFCKMSDVQTRVYRRLLRSPDFQLLISKDSPCSCGSHLTRVECCHRTAPDGVIWSYLHQDDPDGCDWCPFCIVLPCLTKLQQVCYKSSMYEPLWWNFTMILLSILNVFNSSCSAFKALKIELRACSR